MKNLLLCIFTSTFLVACGGSSTDDKSLTENPNPEVPVTPEEPVIPGVPVIPEVPVVPKKPIEPEVPEDPIDPEVPVVPEDPVDPEVPVVPEDPVDPEVPVVPEEPVDPEDPVTPEEPLDPAKIHDNMPNVDYKNAAGIIDYIGFDDRQNGTYTSDMLNTDFNNEWGSVTGKANILDFNSSKMLAVTHPKDQYKKGVSSGKNLNEHNELYFSYQIIFGKDYDFSMGGKMPGLAGLNPDYKDKPDGCKTIGEDEGFSLRSMFRENGRAIGYFYHQDKTKKCGDEIDYQHEGKNFSFKREKAYLIEQYVKMNDANRANGIVTIHVNGFKVLEKTDMTFSENGKYAINYQFFQLWHGGNNSDWAVDRDSTAYFDDVTISSEPVSYKK